MNDLNQNTVTNAILGTVPIDSVSRLYGRWQERKSLLIFGWLLLATPVAVQAQLYTTNNGTITITRYFDTNRAVVIPDTINGLPVTAIGDDAFWEDTSLPSVTIPKSVTSIGNKAFYSCISLTSVTIPDSVTNLGDYAFQGSGLTSVFIPNSVTNIGPYAFNFCSRLTDVTIGNSVSRIGHAAFFECWHLTSITVDGSNPAYSSLDGILFDKAQATLIGFPEGLGGTYAIPNSVTSIGDFAFYVCSLTNVIIPNSVTNLGHLAFSYSGLTSLIIPKSITSIGDSEFYSCSSLTSVTIPNSVTSIGDSAFAFCPSLSSVTIPNSVTNIGPAAFVSCTSLTNVTIPNSVTNIGPAAFSCCTSLISVYFRGNAPGGDSSVFSCRDVDGRGVPATAYYLPGTTGWGSTFLGRPTAVWTLTYPLILTSNPSFGVRTNQFGFTLSWATNLNVVVDAASDLVKPIWSPVATNTLSGGTSYFSDLQWTKYPSRFYRLRWP